MALNNKYSQLDYFHLYNQDVKFICNILSNHFNTKVIYGNYTLTVVKYEDHIYGREIKKKFQYVKRENNYKYHFIVLNDDGGAYKYIKATAILEEYNYLFDENYIKKLIKRHNFLLKDYYNDAIEFIEKYQVIFKLMFDINISYNVSEMLNDKYSFHIFISPSKKNYLMGYYTETNYNIKLSLDGFNIIKRLILSYDTKYELHKPKGKGKSNRKKSLIDEY